MDDSLTINTTITELVEENINPSTFTRRTFEFWFLYENLEGQDTSTETNSMKAATCLGRVKPCSDYQSLVQSIKNNIPKPFTELAYQDYEQEIKIEINHTSGSYQNFVEYFSELAPKQKKIFLTFKKEERKCTVHPDYNLDLLCKECEEIICFTCALESHDTHTKLGWKEYIRNFNQTNQQTNLEHFTKLSEKMSLLKDLLSKITTNKTEIEDNFSKFCQDIVNIKIIFMEKIELILQGANTIKDEKINFIGNSINDLNSKLSQIEILSKRLHIEEQNFEFLLIISEAKKLLKFDYESLLSLQDWKYSLDMQKITEFTQELQISELKFYDKYTKIFFENQEFSEEKFCFKKIFVNEITQLEIQTFNSNNHPTSNEVYSVKMINFTNGKTYVFRKLDNNPQSNSFIGEISFNEKGKFTLYPIINDNVLFSHKKEIEIYSKFCIEKSKVYGVSESIPVNSTMNILIDAFDNQENKVYYGGEKFRIGYCHGTNFEAGCSFKYFDTKDGKYHAFGKVSHIGNLKVSIEILKDIDNENNETWSHMPGSPFDVVGDKFDDSEKSKNLGVSIDYVKDKWKVWQGLRELIQNWRDGLIEGLEIGINETIFTKVETENEVRYDITYQSQSLGFLSYLKNENKLILKNKGKITKDCLALGNSKKRNDPNAAGKFGEGMKLAALSLLRENKKVTINTDNESWKFSIQLDEVYSTFMLFVDFGNRPDNDVEFAETLVENITLTEFEDMISKIVFFKNKEMMSDSCGMLLDPSEKGKIYVKGIFLLDKKQFHFGYNLNQLELDRDRQLIANEKEFNQNLVDTVIENFESFEDQKLYDLLLNLKCRGGSCNYCEFYYYYCSDTEKKKKNYALLQKKLSDEFTRRNPNGIPVLDKGYSDHHERLRLQILPDTSYVTVQAFFLYFVSGINRLYYEYQKYIKDNWIGRWYEDLDESVFRRILDTIVRLESLGFNIDSHFKDRKNYKKGLPPLYLENQMGDLFTNRNKLIILNRKVLNLPNFKYDAPFIIYQLMNVHNFHSNRYSYTYFDLD